MFIFKNCYLLLLGCLFQPLSFITHFTLEYFRTKIFVCLLRCLLAAAICFTLALCCAVYIVLFLLCSHHPTNQPGRQPSIHPSSTISWKCLPTFKVPRCMMACLCNTATEALFPSKSTRVYSLRPCLLLLNGRCRCRYSETFCCFKPSSLSLPCDSQWPSVNG